MPDSDADTPAQPVTAAARPAEARDKEPADRVGEELADDARIWRVYDQVAREDDKERIAGWNRGLDSLALFAALFSAVTTAFIIEARGDMQPDYTQLTFLALNASLTGRPFAQEPFVIPPVARTVNGLWVASLVFSLSAALIAIMGKDWIGMYAARPVCNPRQWAEMRTYRLRCVERWYMPGVIAAAPVLLHVSLLLFIAGLVLFTVPDPFSRRLTLGLSVTAGGLYLITALSAVVFSDSPFKSPATQMLRAALASCLRALCRLILNPRDGVSLPNPLSQSETRSRRRAVLSAADSVVAALRALPRLPRAAWDEIRYRRQHPRTKPLVASVSSLCRDHRVIETFCSSTWTDVRGTRDAETLAKSLSWLNAASQAPEVLRALLFALGDLEIGGRVGPLVSPALRDRIRADIRYNYQKVDFLTLSRYVLADQNLLQNPVLDFSRFIERFHVRHDPSLRCEDGLAAIAQLEFDRAAIFIKSHCPDVVAQPRMMEFLLPRLGQSREAVESILVLAQCYLPHLVRKGTFLKTELLRHMDPYMRSEYEYKMTSEYGWTRDTIGVLTYLSLIAVSSPAREAAVDLTLRFLFQEHVNGVVCEHPCLAYLLGGDSYPLILYEGPGQPLESFELHALISSLPLRTHGAYQWGDAAASPLLDYPGSFQLAIARTLTRILWSRLELWVAHEFIGHDGQKAVASDWDLCVRSLHVLLCHPRSSLSEGSNEDRRQLIRQLIHSPAFRRFHPYSFTIAAAAASISTIDLSSVKACNGILTTIAQHIARLLKSSDNPSRTSEGKSLFRKFVSSELQDGERGVVDWELGRYLRRVVRSFLPQDPSIATSLRSLAIALMEIHPFCEGSSDIRGHWDRICLSAGIDDLSQASVEELRHLLDPSQGPNPLDGHEVSVMPSMAMMVCSHVRSQGGNATAES